MQSRVYWLLVFFPSGAIKLSSEGNNQRGREGEKKRALAKRGNRFFKRRPGDGRGKNTKRESPAGYKRGEEGGREGRGGKEVRGV